jgi:acetyl esterase/lipase
MSHIWTVVPVALVTLAAVAPPHGPRPVASVGFWLGYLVNEFPFFAFCWLVGSALLALGHERLGSPAGLAVLALAVLTACGLALILWRALLAGPVVARALTRDLGLGGLTGQTAGWPATRRVPARAVLWPLPLRARDVQRIANLSYGPAGRRNRLDLYRGRSGPAGAPVLIHFHGGHFRMGGKRREARALFYRLASHGWVCISADYRLRRAGRFPASQIDAKRAIAWARQHAGEYGADPSLLAVAGGSAGAHLASMAALTANDPVFQPGFEDADTSVSAAVCLYGFYGHRDLAGRLPSSPRAYVRRDAPPFFVAHGDNDTFIPAASAESFVDALRGVSMNPVVYARLPGAQHSFDLLHSVRFQHVIDGIEAFTAWVLARRDPPSAQLTTAWAPSPAIPTANPRRSGLWTELAS